ncbi:hypothetical protein JQC91_14630 [Jannaschia sp. Os4]|uniref:hypothetical protein n=1 Tax=Jannaschia sp. Os4 TaxID=2807617 RepID=UPI00193A9D07|nr:hypothetical protein [Jannaschia sp. Os4]MBM2577541.1 hypothetical protein [Jannaschia sp. Os4]
MTRLTPTGRLIAHGAAAVILLLLLATTQWSGAGRIVVGLLLVLAFTGNLWGLVLAWRARERDR